MTRSEYVSQLTRLLDRLTAAGASRAYKLDAIRRFNEEAGR